jgi:hypothetical protein
MKAICIDNEGSCLVEHFVYEAIGSASNTSLVQIKLEDGYTGYNIDRFIILKDGEKPPIKYLINKYNHSCYPFTDEELDQLFEYYSKLYSMVKDLGSEFSLFKKEICRLEESFRLGKELRKSGTKK